MQKRSAPSGLIGAVVVAAAVGAMLLWLSMLVGPWRLVDGLRNAGDHLERAERALSKGELKDARYETLAGQASAARAREGLESKSPLLDLLELSPTVRDGLGEAGHLVRAAKLSADAAVGTLDVAQNALRGPDKIITKEDPEDPKSDSLIRLDRIQEIRRTIGDVRASIRGVRKELKAIDLMKLPRRVRPTITDGIDKASETDELLADAEAGFAVLPTFLGADGPRNYLIGMQNPAELRGTGGAMLQFALLHIDNGHPELAEKASTVYSVDENREPQFIPLPADAWYQSRIPDARRFGNANWSPDWPFSAELTVAYAQATTPDFPDIDGVLLVDPITMEKLMSGVGKFHSNKYGVQVTKDTVVEYLLYRSYAAKPVPRVRKARLRDVVDDFYQHMLKPKHPSELVQGFGDALADKHMQIWLADPREQAFVEHMNWDASLEEAEGADYLNVVQQNVGGNKLDYHASQETIMRVEPSGTNAIVSTNVRITNNVFLPQPRWALGNSGPNHRPMVNVYVPQDAELLSADVKPPGGRIDAAAEGAAAWLGEEPPQHFELGKKVWSAVLGDPANSPPGMSPATTSSFKLTYRVPGVIETSGDRSVYRLVLQHQPKAHPETVEIHLRLPGSATDVKARGWKRSDEATLVFERVLDEDLILEVSWRS